VRSALQASSVSVRWAEDQTPAPLFTDARRGSILRRAKYLASESLEGVYGPPNKHEENHQREYRLDHH